jgi:hypothetical protein
MSRKGLKPLVLLPTELLLLCLLHHCQCCGEVLVLLVLSAAGAGLGLGVWLALWPLDLLQGSSTCIAFEWG